jgi:hypothetical protein
LLDKAMQSVVWGALSEKQKTIVLETALYEHAASDTAKQT